MRVAKNVYYLASMMTNKSSVMSLAPRLTDHTSQKECFGLILLMIIIIIVIITKIIKILISILSILSSLQEQECVPLADVSYYEPDEEQCDK